MQTPRSKMGCVQLLDLWIHDLWIPTGYMKYVAKSWVCHSGLDESVPPTPPGHRCLHFPQVSCFHNFPWYRQGLFLKAPLVLFDLLWWMHSDNSTLESKLQCIGFLNAAISCTFSYEWTHSHRWSWAFWKTSDHVSLSTKWMDCSLLSKEWVLHASNSPLIL